MRKNSIRSARTAFRLNVLKRLAGVFAEFFHCASLVGYDYAVVTAK